MEKALFTIIAIVFVIAIGAGAYFLERSINAWLYYDGATEQIICKMVKPDHLTAYGAEACKS